MASVVSINISEKKGVPKDSVEVGELIEDFGLKGDAHAKNWHKQISLLGQESIDRMTAGGATNLRPGIFAENITTEGVTLFELPIGTKFLMGECELEVTQIGKECHERCAIYYQAGDCVMPREGIFAKILKGGMVKKGDIITVLGA